MWEDVESGLNKANERVNCGLLWLSFTFKPNVAK